MQALLDTLDVLAPTCAVLGGYTQTTLTPCKDNTVDDNACAPVEDGAPCTSGCRDALNMVSLHLTCQTCWTEHSVPSFSPVVLIAGLCNARLRRQDATACPSTLNKILLVCWCQHLWSSRYSSHVKSVCTLSFTAGWPTCGWGSAASHWLSIWLEPSWLVYGIKQQGATDVLCR